MMYLNEDSDEARAMRQNILNLMTSDDEANFNIALQLMKGGGFVPECVPIVWNKIFDMRKRERKTLLNFLKKNVPADLYKSIEASLEYDNKLHIFFTRYANRLVRYEGITWENLLENLLPRLVDYHQAQSEITKTFLLNHPDVPKHTLLRVLIGDGTDLALSDTGIDALPEEIGDFPQITYLSITNTKIATVPDSFYRLTNLENLYHSDTPLAEDKSFVPSLKERMPKLWVRLLYDDVYYLSFEKRLAQCSEMLAICPDFSEAFTAVLDAYEDHRYSYWLQPIIEFFNTYSHGLPTDDAYTQNRIGMAYMSFGLFDHAWDFLESATKSLPSDDTYWYNLADCALNRGLYREAEQAGKAALAINGGSVQACLSLCEAYLRLDKPQKALQTIQSGLYNAGGQDIFCLERAVYVHKILGDVHGAEKNLENIFAHEKNYTETNERLLLARLYKEKKRNKDAIRVYRTILEDTFDFQMETQLALGELYLQGQQYIKAEIVLREVVQYDKKSHEGWYRLAAVMCAQGDLDEALSCLREALESGAGKAKTVREDALFAALIGQASFEALLAEYLA